MLNLLYKFKSIQPRSHTAMSTTHCWRHQEKWTKLLLIIHIL